MKWLVASILVCMVTHGSGGAIKCAQLSTKAECPDQEQVLSINPKKEVGQDPRPEIVTVYEPPTKLEDVSIPDISIEPEVLRKPEAVELFKGPDVHDAECLAGSEWQSHCYSCRCSESGLAECLRIYECNEFQEAKPIHCRPGTSFQRGCNTCTCLDNGLGLCTLKACKSHVPVPPTQPSGHDCAPGSSWSSQCNTCTCTEDGRATCTKKLCLGQESEPQMMCAPKSEWKSDCNECWCTDTGFPLCTRLACFNTVNMFFDDKAQEKDEAHIEKENQDEIAAKNNLNGADWSISHNVIKRSQVCKPNENFQSDCNTCKCAGDGQSYRCTQNECMDREDRVDKEVEVFMESEGVDHIERHSVCRAQGVFYIGCNTCHCNYDGTDYTCTNKPCPLPEDVELFHELRATNSAQNKTVVCVANRMFVKDCNTCWCNEDGTGFFCTRKVCVGELPDEGGFDFDKPEELRVIKRTCRPDEVFEIDCNMCRCNPDGQSYSCTRRACLSEEAMANEGVQYYSKNASFPRKVRAVSQEPQRKACEAGQEFRMDCNKCLCDPTGKDFSCTRIDCRAINGNTNSGTRRRRDVTKQENVTCVPGSVFDRDCNVCRCHDDGKHATCTIKNCSKTVDENLPEADPNFRCYPGEQFKRSCNDCTCSADGRSVFCTLRICETDLSPPL